jgi:transcriptional regulator with XRE-family HTH domain|nr:MAG TPA: Helix-turn-helix XRE-family like protein [Caudoviricetes sp.]
MADKLRHFLHIAGVQGISVAALSEKSGISKTTIYRYANGHGSPTVDAMKLIAEALGCTVREAFPEVYSKVDVPTVNITDTLPISTAKLAMQYGMTTREFNQALFRAGIQIQRSDGSYVVAGNFADMVTYQPVKTEHGTVQLFAMWTLTARKVIQSLLEEQGIVPAAGMNVGSSERPTR